MIGALLLAAAQGTALQQAVEESKAGRFLKAWDSAQRALTPVERAQAETFVRYHAGDLEGALQTAEAGLEQAGQDAYLRSTACEIALTLRATSKAAQHLKTWEWQVAGAADAALSAARTGLQGLLEAESASRRAELRAKWMLAGGAIGSMLALAWLLRTPARPGSAT